jgi:hypothetical protein
VDNLERFTLQEFRDIFNNFFKNTEINRENLESFFYVYHKRLPLFPDGHYKKISTPDSYREWHDIGDSVKTEIREKRYFFKDAYYELVPINNLCGDSWVFKNDFFDGRPLPERLASLFLAKKPEDITAAFATKVNENLIFTDDGNHRIYAAYLRGWPVHLFIEGEFV